jgi:hypothetical protein
MKLSNFLETIRELFKEIVRQKIKHNAPFEAWSIGIFTNSKGMPYHDIKDNRTCLNKLAKAGVIQCGWWSQYKSYFPTEEMLKELTAEALEELGLPPTYFLDQRIERIEKVIKEKEKDLRKTRKRLKALKAELESKQTTEGELI